MVTSTRLPCDQTLPLSVKGVACETMSDVKDLVPPSTHTYMLHTHAQEYIRCWEQDYHTIRKIVYISKPKILGLRQRTSQNKARNSIFQLFTYKHEVLLHELATSDLATHDCAVDTNITVTKRRDGIRVIITASQKSVYGTSLQHGRRKQLSLQIYMTNSFSSLQKEICTLST